MLAIVMISCNNIKDPEFKRIEAIDLDKVNFNNSSVKVNVIYFNPNKFSATLKEARGDAFIDSALLGHFTVDTIIVAPAKSDFIIPVNLKVDMNYILQNSMSLLSKQEVLIRLTGTAKAGKSGIYKNFPILYEGKQNVQELFK